MKTMTWYGKILDLSNSDSQINLRVSYFNGDHPEETFERDVSAPMTSNQDLIVAKIVEEGKRLRDFRSLVVGREAVGKIIPIP
jgi:hypothetical protein